jgi:hypothetical protein
MARWASSWGSRSVTTVLAPQAAIASRSLSRSLAQGPPIANLPGREGHTDLPPVGAGVDRGDLQRMGVAGSGHLFSLRFADGSGRDLGEFDGTDPTRG